MNPTPVRAHRYAARMSAAAEVAEEAFLDAEVAMTQHTNACAVGSVAGARQGCETGLKLAEAYRLAQDANTHAQRRAELAKHAADDEEHRLD